MIIRKIKLHNKCLDCNKTIDQRSKRCQKCENSQRTMPISAKKKLSKIAKLIVIGEGFR